MSILDRIMSAFTKKPAARKGKSAKQSRNAGEP
jgi:hypothetical protein